MSYLFKLKNIIKLPVLDLFTYLKNNRKKQFLNLIILMLFCAFLEAICVPVTISFLNYIVGEQNTFELNKFAIKFFNSEDNATLLFFSGFLLIILNLANGFFRMINISKYTQFSASVGTELSMNIYKSALYNSYQKHLENDVSELINKSSMSIQRTVTSLVMLMQLLTSFFISIFLISSLFLVDWRSFLILFLLFLSFYLLITYFTRDIYNKNSILINEYSAKQISWISDSMGLFVDIYLRSGQDDFVKKYLKIDKPMRQLIAKNIFYTNRPKFLIESFGIVLIISTLLINIINGNSMESIFTLLGVFILAYQKLLPALQQVYSSYSIIAYNQDSVRSVINSLSIYPSATKNIKSNNNTNSPNNIWEKFKNINFDNVSFSYLDSEKNKNILENISISIKSGEKIGIIGETGAGKSTFINLIMGLIQPTNGNIFIDDKNISKPNSNYLKKWQSLISYVPQRIYLSNKTIAENIAIDQEISEIDFNKLSISAEKANIKEFIISKPESFFTKVGDRGAKLSGGQAQRIALARAFYLDSKVIIFDEPTSALDKINEAKIMDSLFSQFNDKTLIIISHRISSLKKCDRFFKLENKKLREIYINNFK